MIDFKFGLNLWQLEFDQIVKYDAHRPDVSRKIINTSFSILYFWGYVRQHVCAVLIFLNLFQLGLLIIKTANGKVAKFNVPVFVEINVSGVEVFVGDLVNMSMF